jgi:tRNA A58 N-methylase Trm61
MIHKFNSALAFSKFYLDQNYDFQGQSVIDATVGNGHDTQWLLEKVGDSGRVFGFDIQEKALETAGVRLKDHRNLDLILDGHENLSNYSFGEVACVLYNLGYLPRGDKTMTTKPDTTIASIQAASRLLKVGGVIMIIAYPGHGQGREEAQALESHLASYSQQTFQSWKLAFLNQKNNPPILYCLEKRRSE